MSNTFAITCPKNNPVATTKAMLSGQDVLCKAFGLGSKDVLDKDPQADKYRVSLSWGALMMSAKAASKFVHTDKFDRYNILTVDDYGTPYGPVAGFTGNTDRGRKSDCCNPNEYSLQMQGTWPAGATRFMIVPATSGGFVLPMGVMTNKFTDVSSGGGEAMTVHTTSTTLKMTAKAATDFMASPDRFVIMQKSIAESNADLKMEHIVIVSITLVTSRRLGETEGRRLEEESSLKVDFQVILPAASPIKFVAATIDVAKMKVAIKKNAAAAGVTVEVIGTPSVAAVVTTTIGGETVTGDASPMAGSALAALIMAIATMVMA